MPKCQHCSVQYKFKFAERRDYQDVLRSLFDFFKTSKPMVEKVRLLRSRPITSNDAGTILAIAPARMRNHLYPRSQAAYMTVAEVRQAVANEMVMERDVSFGSGKQVPVKKEKQISYDMKMITVSITIQYESTLADHL